MGWLAAAAAAHNKEQHAINGNINTVLSAQFKAADQYAVYRAAFWDRQRVQIDRLTNDADLIRQACAGSRRIPQRADQRSDSAPIRRSGGG